MSLIIGLEGQGKKRFHCNVVVALSLLPVIQYLARYVQKEEAKVRGNITITIIVVFSSAAHLEEGNSFAFVEDKVLINERWFCGHTFITSAHILIQGVLKTDKGGNQQLELLSLKKNILHIFRNMRTTCWTYVINLTMFVLLRLLFHLLVHGR